MIHRPIGFRGFILLEMIATLAVLTVFALISSQLFSETMGIVYRAPAAQDTMTRFESVSQSLRQDAWGSRWFTAAGANAIEIDSPNHAIIQWEIDAAGDVYRTEGAERRRWSGVGASAVLEIDGPCIVFRSTSPAADSGGEVRCVSLVQLAALHRGGK